MDEIQLVRDAVSDANAFADLFRMHVARVYRYHMIHIGNVKDADLLVTQASRSRAVRMRCRPGTTPG
jgi:hypothetical protein